MRAEPYERNGPGSDARQPALGEVGLPRGPLVRLVAVLSQCPTRSPLLFTFGRQEARRQRGAVGRAKRRSLLTGRVSDAHCAARAAGIEVETHEHGNQHGRHHQTVL